MCMSRVSSVKVRSEPMDFSSRVVAISRESRPCEAAHSPRAAAGDPVACMRAASSICDNSATECTPQALSRFSSDGPTPGMPRNGIICTNCADRAAGMSSMPFGLALVEAILATNLLQAMPTEQVTLNRSATCCRIHAPIALGLSHSSSAPDTSIYPSSTETCSNWSVMVRKTSCMMRCDIMR